MDSERADHGDNSGRSPDGDERVHFQLTDTDVAAFQAWHSAPARALPVWLTVLMGTALGFAALAAQTLLSLKVLNAWERSLDHRPTFQGGEQWLSIGYAMFVAPVNLVVLIALFVIGLPVSYGWRADPYAIVWAMAVVLIPLSFLSLAVFWFVGPPGTALPLAVAEVAPIAAALWIYLRICNASLK